MKSKSFKFNKKNIKEQVDRAVKTLDKKKDEVELILVGDNPKGKESVTVEPKDYCPCCVANCSCCDHKSGMISPCTCRCHSSL